MVNEAERNEQLKRKLVELFERRFMCDPTFRNLVAGSQLNAADICLFGGALRDLMTFGEEAPIRDVDVVIDRKKGLKGYLRSSDLVVRRNGFGGYSFTECAHSFDVWRLGDTWAFQHDRQLTVSFSELPRTTFLNVEAVALVFDDDLKVHNVHEYGFFDAIQARLLEINYEDNPNPCGCIARSLVTARRLKFDLGPRLVRYIAQKQHAYPIEQYRSFLNAHYKAEHFTQDELVQFLGAIASHYAERPGEPLKGEQLAGSAVLPRAAKSTVS